MADEERQRVSEDELVNLVLEDSDAKTQFVFRSMKEHLDGLKEKADVTDLGLVETRLQLNKVENRQKRLVNVAKLGLGGLGAIIGLLFCSNVILLWAVFVAPRLTPVLTSTPTATIVPPTQAPTPTVPPMPTGTLPPVLTPTAPPSRATFTPVASSPTRPPEVSTPTRTPSAIPSPTNTATPTAVPIVCRDERCVAELKVLQVDGKEVEHKDGKPQIKTKAPFLVSFVVYSKEPSQLDLYPGVTLLNGSPKPVNVERKSAGVSSAPTPVTLSVLNGIDGPGRYLVKIGYALPGGGDDFHGRNGEPAILEIEIIP